MFAGFPQPVEMTRVGMAGNVGMSMDRPSYHVLIDKTKITCYRTSVISSSLTILYYNYRQANWSTYLLLAKLVKPASMCTRQSRLYIYVNEVVYFQWLSIRTAGWITTPLLGCKTMHKRILFFFSLNLVWKWDKPSSYPHQAGSIIL